MSSDLVADARKEGRLAAGRCLSKLRLAALQAACSGASRPPSPPTAPERAAAEDLAAAAAKYHAAVRAAFNCFAAHDHISGPLRLTRGRFLWACKRCGLLTDDVDATTRGSARG